MPHHHHYEQNIHKSTEIPMIHPHLQKTPRNINYCCRETQSINISIYGCALCPPIDDRVG